MRSVGLAGRPDNRNREGGEDAGDRRMDARKQDREPEQGKAGKIDRKRADAETIEGEHGRQDDDRRDERHNGEARGIEERNDRHRAHVVNDRDRHQKQLERGWGSRAEKRKHADREGDIGSSRNGPTICQGRIAPITAR